MMELGIFCNVCSCPLMIVQSNETKHQAENFAKVGKE